MKKYAIIALASLVLASCKKQGVVIDPPVVSEAKDATITLKITSAANIGTYASTSGSHEGTANEKVIKTLDVFLYNEDASLSPAGYERFSGNDASLNTPKLIKTKTGPKRIYIGINLPVALANQLKDNYQVMQSPYAVNMAELATASDGLMMFNQNIASLEIKEGNHADNKISIPVARLLAKAGILQHKDLSLNINTVGTLSNLQYTIGQRNKNIFVGHLYDFKDANWTYISPTLSAAEYAAAFTGVRNTEYKPVDAKLTATEYLNTVYIPENTSEKSEHSQVTYVQIKTKLTPAALEDGALPANGTFYVMFGQEGSDRRIYQRYFATKTAADNAAKETKYWDNATNKKLQTAVLTYDNGLCYYRLYLNEDQLAGANKVGIFRNTFFKAQISKFNGLGAPLEGLVPGGPGTPGNPGGGVVPIGPVDPEGPVNPGNLDASIEAIITIQPWSLITSEHEI
ncbi:Mfa1 family fimbria major subunit [Sphingobacterium spiritivorum]|uniref:Mfa1 family fimbria major subunit n=1 Tax=Sphingobacterium spiritivorum TaxID=258 RepID=UPI003DA4204D